MTTTRKTCFDPARSETLSMPGSDLHGSWEISSVPERQASGGTGKAQSHNPVVYAGEKSDTPVVPEKPPNKGDDPAEEVEGRGVAKGNVSKCPACRTQSRNNSASMGLEGVRVVDGEEANASEGCRNPAELMRRRHQPVAIVGKWLNRVVQGYINYHAVPGNLYRMGSMCKDICRAWRHALMRRSQRPKMPWDRFNRIAKRFMPPIRNAHPYPEERFYASHT